MADTTGISWTDHTWNPWMGCQKVSPGCANCYMFTDQARYGRDPATVQRSKTRFDAPLKWKKPALVFTCSWSDWFHPDADAWRVDAWEIVRRTPHLTYQILTKRPAGIVDRLPTDWGQGYPNVWLGLSAENQTWLERRWPLLMAVPAAVRFISAEPLLGPLNLSGITGLDWIITGGESGPGARSADLDWFRSIRDQCRQRGIAYHHKQNGGTGRDKGGHLLDGEHLHAWPTSAVPAAAA
jgi:protein gp37